MNQLNKKVQQAIKIMKIADEEAMIKGSGTLIDIHTYNGTKQIDDTTLELCYSGGKDSDVVLHLAKMAGIKFNAIYKNTTIDPPYTIKHAKNNGAIIVKPKRTFFQLVEQKGYPSRFVRFCCEQLKEYKISNVATYGIRSDEGVKRAERYKEPNFCRVYNKKEKTSVWLPILNWSKQDIEEFVNSEKIECHPLYYDENGRFHAERRLGCCGCPLASKKNRIEEFKKYPKFFRQYIISGRKFVESHKDNKTIKIFESAESLMFYSLFCSNIEDYKLKTNGMFGILDTKQWLEDYFQIEL